MIASYEASAGVSAMKTVYFRFESEIRGIIVSGVGKHTPNAWSLLEGMPFWHLQDYTASFMLEIMSRVIYKTVIGFITNLGIDCRRSSCLQWH